MPLYCLLSSWNDYIIHEQITKYATSNMQSYLDMVRNMVSNDVIQCTTYGIPHTVIEATWYHILKWEVVT